MSSPFPGTDPYLEERQLWPDVHLSLITAIRDALTPQVAPRYYDRIERRTYAVQAFEIREAFLHIRDNRTHEVVTAIEVLSPTNKTVGQGRAEYERKRHQVLRSLTNLVEIDLIR